MSYSPTGQKELTLHFGIKRVYIQFPSKKNKVFLVNLASDGRSSPAVLKVYRAPSPALTVERGFLAEAERRGLNVPHILDYTRIVSPWSSSLDTNPMFTPAKFGLVRNLPAVYETLNCPIDDKQLNREIAQTRRKKVRFRPRQRDLLLLQAQRIEEKGVRGPTP